MRVNDFQAHYLPDGQAKTFAANIDYQAGDDLNTDTWRPYRLEVNHPLRVGGDRVYLQGHGYAPTFTVTFPDGQSRSQTVQWRPEDQRTLLSSGVIRIDPPARHLPRPRASAASTRSRSRACWRRPNNSTASCCRRASPALNNPAVAVDIYRGDTGLDSGRPQSLFSLDPRLIDQGRLAKLDRVNLRAGEQVRLDDGTLVRFDGATPFVNLQVSHDPAQIWVLVFALTMMAGLLVSLVIRRRRIWVRVTRPGRSQTAAHRYRERRTGRPGAHRQLRLGRRVRAAHRTTARAACRAASSRRSEERGLMNTEHVDLGLARYSDWAFTSSVVVLVVALLLLAVELAYSRSRKVAERELVLPARRRRRRRQRHAPAWSSTPRVAPSTSGSAGPGWPWSTLGIALLFACIVLRGLATDAGAVGQHVRVHQPDQLLGLIAAAVVLRRPQYRAAVGLRALPVLILLTVSGPLALHQRRPGDAGAAVATGCPSTCRWSASAPGCSWSRAWPASCSCSRCRGSASPDTDGPIARIVHRLPDAQTLDRIAYRTTIFAFPVFGFGVIFGAIWAEEAWGRYWGWDPKETVSFIAWVVYAAYLHARSTAGWRDRKAAWINVVGFVAMVFNLFFINLVVTGPALVRRGGLSCDRSCGTASQREARLGDARGIHACRRPTTAVSDRSSESGVGSPLGRPADPSPPRPGRRHAPTGARNRPPTPRRSDACRRRRPTVAHAVPGPVDRRRCCASPSGRRRAAGGGCSTRLVRR